ncbi:hypothetical protein DID96_19975 [Burkholderia sp. Bp8963]|nr:hypothetical protein DID96_19975 [Burkholderia sp. Bp8963]
MERPIEPERIFSIGSGSLQRAAVPWRQLLRARWRGGVPDRKPGRRAPSSTPAGDPRARFQFVMAARLVVAAAPVAAAPVAAAPVLFAPAVACAGSLRTVSALAPRRIRPGACCLPGVPGAVRRARGRSRSRVAGLPDPAEPERNAQQRRG